MVNGNIKLMLLEDDTSHAEAIRRALESSETQFEVQVTGSMLEYRESVVANPPDIALLDMLLPDGHSLELLTSPSEIDTFPKLILTSHGNEQFAVTAMKTGALDYIVKSPEVFADMSGILTRALSQWQVVRDRKQVEEELLIRSQILDHLAEGISFVRLSDLVIIYSNSKFDEMFGYDRDGLIGHRMDVLNAPGKPSPEEVVEEILKHLKERNEWHGEIHSIRKDGSCFWCQSSVTIFEHPAHGKVSVSTHEDITERKQIEEQLIITDRLASIGQLASGIAHEINNPLTGIIGLSELMLDADVPTEVKSDLETINREARRTAKIVQGLLTFARKHPQEKQPVDINDTIAQVLQLRAYEQRVNNINVVTQFAPKLPEIRANAFQLQQVFINIIINSEYFMTAAHGRGTLTISTEQAADIVRISFIDDGPGIIKENLEHLFDPFFTTKEVGNVTGLGLSICHGIITGRGGRIYAESELGRGATFIVELPIIAAGNEGDDCESG